MSAIETSNFGAAALLFVTAWAVGFSAETVPAWSLWAAAALTAACGAYAFLVSNQHAAWALIALGVWLFVAPWALGFTASVTAFWAHIAASLGLAALAAVIIWRSGQGDMTVAA
jgi:hypothetical protein